MAIQVWAAENHNGNAITGIADPSAATDAASKQYVDNVARGLTWKASVRAASTANVNIASAPSTLDGVTLANGDRVLLKNQTAPAENGIRVFTAAAAALARAVDADSSAEVPPGMAVTVTEGTVHADQVWILTTNAAITLDTTSLAFSQLGGGTAITAGAGLTGTSTFAVGAGTGIVVNADDVAIDPNVVVRKFAANIGDGSTTALVVTHNLGTRDVQVQIYRNSSPWDTVYPEVERTDANTVTCRFSAAPTSAQYRAVVQA